MIYPILVDSQYIQTDNILGMSVSGSNYSVIMLGDGSITVTKEQFYDIINCINANHA